MAFAPPLTITTVITDFLGTAPSLEAIIAFQLPEALEQRSLEKHRGLTESQNLCLSCFDCNKAKGSDVAAADPVTGLATFLFHPRNHPWADHFHLNGTVIEPLTPEGRVTVFLLDLNSDERIVERSNLIRLQRCPCEKPNSNG